MSALEGTMRGLEARLENMARGCLDRFPLEHYTSAVEQWPESLPYEYECPNIRAMDTAIETDHGLGVLEVYHQLALLRLLASARNKPTWAALPNSIREAYTQSFTLILKDMKTKRESSGRFLMTNSSWTPYWAYLGLVALKIVPAGIRLMIPEQVNVRGTPLGQHGFRACPGQEIAWMFRTHLHPVPKRVPGMLNLESMRRSLRLSAAMLEFRKDFVAILGRSWFYDPLLPDVSPRFGYMPGLLAEVGAILQRLEPEDLTNHQATQTSPTRKKLFEQGKYQPSPYFALIPRESLIQWARHCDT